MKCFQLAMDGKQDGFASGALLFLLFSSLHVVTSQPVPASPALNCILHPASPMRDALKNLLLSGAKLVELKLVLHQYPPLFLDRKLRGLLWPHRWTRSTGKQGHSLLVLKDNYDFMSLFFLKIGVYDLTVHLEDSPRGCLENTTEEDTMVIIRTLLLNDFKPQGEGDETGSLSEDQQICFMKIKAKDGIADFLHSCCHITPDDDTVCSDVTDDKWINLLLLLIRLIKWVVVLFSPYFIPRNLYRAEYFPKEYVYQRDPVGGNGMTQEVKVKVKFVDKNKYKPSRSDNPREKVVKTKDMRHLQRTIRHWQREGRLEQGQVYDLSFKHPRLSVEPERLLDDMTVPAGLSAVLYDNLVLCKIRELPLWDAWCSTRSKLLCGVKPYLCGQALAKTFLLLVFVCPWFFRLGLYYLYESKRVAEKRETAGRLGLKVGYSGAVLLYFSPVHVLFLTVYGISLMGLVVVDIGFIKRWLTSWVYGVVRRSMRDGAALFRWGAVMKWVLGRLGGCWAPIRYLLSLVCVLTVGPAVALLLFLPFLDLSLRLLGNLIGCLYQCMCPKSDPQQPRLQARLVRAAVAFISLVSFWSLTLILMETLAFFVEMTVYTLMGIIVNAGSAVQIIFVVFLIVIYSRTIFSEVYTCYQTYHKQIHRVLLNLKRAHINQVAKLDEEEQPDTVFHVQGYPNLYYIGDEDEKRSASRGNADKGGKGSGLEADLVKKLDEVKNEAERLKESKIYCQILSITTEALRERVDREPLVPNAAGKVSVNAGLENSKLTSTNPFRLTVKDGQLKWETCGFLLFLDSRDNVFTPKKFFYESVLLNYWAAPGPLYFQFIGAFKSFALILVFLFFVFIVVMAFGDTYRVSSTNQLLATAAGGLAPFLYITIIKRGSAASQVETDSVQFQTELQNCIEDFNQSWPVSDIGGRHKKTSPKNLRNPYMSISVPKNATQTSSVRARLKEYFCLDDPDRDTSDEEQDEEGGSEEVRIFGPLEAKDEDVLVIPVPWQTGMTASRAGVNFSETLNQGTGMTAGHADAESQSLNRETGMTPGHADVETQPLNREVARVQSLREQSSSVGSALDSFV